MRGWWSVVLVGCAGEDTFRPEVADLRGLARLGTTSAWSTPEPVEAATLAWGDHDGDGDLDLAVGKLGAYGDLVPGKRTEVWDADRGSLSVGWISPYDMATSDLAWADQDDDGDLDLLMAAAATGANVPDRLLDNTGAGFELYWQAWDPDLALANAATASVALADLDGDGDLDLARGQSGYLNGALQTVGYGLGLHENTGSGFTLRWAASPSRIVQAVALGDLDGDGDADLVEAASNGQNRLWRNDGGFAFSLMGTDPAVGRYTRGVALGDMDADGDLDLAWADGGDSNRVWRNTGGSLVPFWTSVETDVSQEVAWGDWDGDGDLDLAYANSDAPARVYENTGATFVLAWSAPVSEPTTDVAWGDWDGDGDLDLAVAHDGAPLRVYANGSSSARLVLLPPSPGEAGARTTIRVIGATPGATLRLYYAGARGSQPAPGCAGTRLDLAQRLLVPDQPLADANGEATFTVDVPATWAGRTGYLQVLERSTCTTGPVFAHAVPSWLDASAASLAEVAPTPNARLGSAVASLGDPDGDGDVDLLAGASGANAVVLWTSSGGTVDQALAPRLVGEAAGDAAGAALDVVDLDGDGALDVVVGAPGNDRTGSGAGAVFVVSGPVAAGSLAAAGAVVVGRAAGDEAGAGVRAIGDATGDGAPDLLVGAPGEWTPQSDAGAAYLLSGASLSGVVDLSAPAFRVTGVEQYERIGEAMEGADVDGDGSLDLVLGGDGADSLAPDAGALYVFRGPLTGDLPSSAADVTLVHDEGLARLGSALLVSGDLDGDGAPDLAVSAPAAGLGGEVYVLDGAVASGAAPERAATILETGRSSGWLGASLATDDLDGDGADDLVVGERNAGGDDLGGATVGLVEVFYGPLPAGAVSSDDADRVWAGPGASASFGSAVGVAADADRDGDLEVVVGSGGVDGGAWLVPTF